MRLVQQPIPKYFIVPVKHSTLKTLNNQNIFVFSSATLQGPQVHLKERRKVQDSCIQPTRR